LRSAYSSGMSGSASIVWTLPFTSRSIRAMDAGLPWDSRRMRPTNHAFARRH
jgi:hypothetical protein